jgi:hypothetical protein
LEFYRLALKDFIESKDYMSYANLSEKIGDEYNRLGNQYDAQKHWTNAQTKYANLDTDAYINISNNKIIPALVSSGSIDAIAKCYYQIAKTLKLEYDYRASDYYEKSINYYESTTSSTQLSIVYKEYAHYLLEIGLIDKSMYYFEKIIYASMDTRFGDLIIVPDIFTLLLCVLTKNDVVLANNKVKEYCDVSNTFNDSREHKFIVKIIECLESNDESTFITSSADYNKIKSLKPHEVKLLLEIKKKIAENNDVHNDFDLT